MLDAHATRFFDGVPVRVGISACLLGERVRYDGDHKRNEWLVGELGPQVTWVRICPEVELGLGVPREAISLVRQRDGAIHLFGMETGRELAAAMRAYAAARVETLAAENLSGYVLKSKSPSCGIDSVAVLARVGAGSAEPGRGAGTGEREAVYRELEFELLSRDGRGFFAAALLARFPDLPVVEERALADAAGRAAFLERVRGYTQRHRRQS